MKDKVQISGAIPCNYHRKRPYQANRANIDDIFDAPPRQVRSPLQLN